MRFPGIIPALTTPFGADGTVDHAALERGGRLVGEVEECECHGRYLGEWGSGFRTSQIRNPPSATR